MDFKEWFKNMRYSILFKYIKYCTPKFFPILEKASREGIIRIKELDLFNALPRPSILEIKNHFKDKYLVGCEIGVNAGLNSMSIMNTLNIDTLFLIDCWENYSGIDLEYDSQQDIYEKVVKMVKGYPAIILRGYSSEVYEQIDDNSLDFIYIDGNHNYQYVLDDLNLYYYKVKENGFIAGHDINLDSVKFAVYEFCKWKNLGYKFIYPDFIIHKLFSQYKELNNKSIMNQLNR